MSDTDNPIVDMLTLRKDLYLVMSLLLADKEMAKAQNVVVWTQGLPRKRNKKVDAMDRNGDAWLVGLAGRKRGHLQRAILREILC